MRVVDCVTFEDWRPLARKLLAESVHPADVSFESRAEQKSLFDSEPDAEELASSTTSPATVPAEFLTLSQKVCCHRSPGRFGLLYRILWRLTHGEPHLLKIATDDDVHRVFQMEKEVRRDAHKAKAFVRFREVEHEGETRFIAWHRPDHRILPLVAPFFSRRFVSMHWTVLTPDQSATWDRERLTYGPGVPQSEAPDGDRLEGLWRTYYRSIFNPARIKLDAMRKELPVRYWQTLPEADIIDDLIAEAPERVERMIRTQEGFATSATDFLPEEQNWASLSEAARDCAGCPLCRSATQTVFGVGPEHARLMLVGEQPGDTEDRVGEPFVGPAGEVLDAALAHAGLDRSSLYVTNTVKHFKFRMAGKRRLHQKPDAREILACKPWLDAEIDLIRPDVLVCLGATAAQAVIGRDFKVTQRRGEFVPTEASPSTIATYHPSAILRAPEGVRQENLMRMLVRDLSAAADRLRELTA